MLRHGCRIAFREEVVVVGGLPSVVLTSPALVLDRMFGFGMYEVCCEEVLRGTLKVICVWY